MENDLRNSFHGFLGFITPVIFSLVITPYLIAKLTPDLYGIYILCITCMGMFSLLDFGIGQGVIKFISENLAKNNIKEIRDIIGVSTYFAVLLGAIGGGLMVIFSNDLAGLFKISKIYFYTAERAFSLSALGFFLNFLSNIYSSIPQACHRYDINTKIQLIIWFVLNLSIVAILYFGWGLEEVILINLIFAFLRFLTFFLVYKRLFPTLSLIPNFRFKVLRKIFSFSGYSALNNITGNLVYRIDKVIVGSFLGSAAVTYYSIPFNLVQVGFGIIESGNRFIFPRTSSLNYLGELNEIKKVYLRGINYSSIICSFFTILFITIGNSFISLWLGPAFAERTSSILPILAVVFCFHSLSVTAFHVYNGLGLSQINMISSLVGSISYLLVALMAIPHFGFDGAAISFAFSVIPFPFYLYYLSKILGIENKKILVLFSKSFFGILLVSASMIFIKSYISHVGNVVINFIFMLVISVIMSIFVFYILGFIKRSQIFLFSKWANN
jgi:O-antigen/teichoic acid export membrane protein